MKSVSPDTRSFSHQGQYEDISKKSLMYLLSPKSRTTKRLHAEKFMPPSKNSRSFSSSEKFNTNSARNLNNIRPK